VEVRRRQDLWAGLLLVATGAAALLVAREYPFGSVLRMGPGFFPRVLGVILVLLGLPVAVRGLRGGGEEITGGWSPRALILLPLSMVVFGVLVEHAGFVPALAALIVGSAAAGREFRLGEVLLLTVALTALSVAVFVWALGLPYPLIRGF
jgi:putative tricarboxylic transport membrane protein